ncbi:hypothetical protein JCM19000A_10940 [Silvimonas sp. JCM 19000]
MSTRKRWIKHLQQQIEQIDVAQQQVRQHGGVEDLHQLRIQLRSVRIQLLPVARYGALHTTRAALSQISAASNLLRDRDVMLELVAGWPAPYAQEARQLIEGRAPDLRAARTALLPRDWTTQISALPHTLRHDVPSGAALQRKIRQTARQFRRKARGELRALVPGCPAACWHRTRITLKKVRYLHEELGDWLPRRWQRLSKQAKPAQDALGHLHDLDVLQQHYGASFSAALNQHWQGQRAAALAAAEIAATRVLRALHGGKTRKAIRENQA